MTSRKSRTYSEDAVAEALRWRARVENAEARAEKAEAEVERLRQLHRKDAVICQWPGCFKVRPFGGKGIYCHTHAAMADEWTRRGGMPPVVRVASRDLEDT